MRTISALLFLLPAIGIGVLPAQSTSAASNEGRARSLVDAALTDKNPDTRAQAVEALSLIGPREPYLSHLESMVLEDKDLAVRLAAITSLMDLKNKRTVPVLLKMLNDEVPEVSFAAAKALWTLNEPSGREALISVLSGETKISSGFFTKQKRDALRMLHTPKTMFLFAVKSGASLAPVPGLGMGVSSLQGLLSDPGVSGRAATALLLSQDKHPDVLPALRDALNDKDWSVRAAAVHAIALRDDPALAKELIPLFEDKKEAVRARAAAGYLRLGLIQSTPPKPVPKQQQRRPK